MAVVQGIKEKVHSPIYDSLAVDAEEQLRTKESSSVLKFFVNVQNKTKLETNLQAASLLPHYNTFEARAMRVVISDLPPAYPKKVDVEVEGLGDSGDQTLDLDLKRAMELLDEARLNSDRKTTIDTVASDVVNHIRESEEGDTSTTEQTLTVADLEGALLDADNKDLPASEQVRGSDGVGTLISKLIYNTVTTFYVGEKIMIQMPTWFFPAGAGAYSDGLKFSTHGEPSPAATFRFAEPIFVDKQQNFRVEIEIPDSDVLREIQKIYGPLFIWVVLDGYMTRDVQ